VAKLPGGMTGERALPRGGALIASRDKDYQDNELKA
jgi:hypothetical protein